VIKLESDQVGCERAGRCHHMVVMSLLFHQVRTPDGTLKDTCLLQNIDRNIFGGCRPTEIIKAHDGDFIITGMIFSERGINGIPILKINSDFDILYTESIFDIEFSSASNIISNPDNTYTLFGGVGGQNLNVYGSTFMMITSADYPWSTDFSDNHNDLQTDGVTCLREGIFGDALDLSSEEGGVAFVQDNESLRSEQFRIEAWFRMDSTLQHEGVVVSKLIEDGFSSFQLYANNIEGNVGFALTTESGNEFIDINTNLDNDDWHYIAGDFDGEQIRLIWDGNLVGIEEIDSPILYGDGSFVIGGDADYARSDLQFFGQIDEVMFSNEPFDHVGVPDESRILLPEELGISTIYPNPFNATTTIAYNLPISGEIRLSIQDLQGREISVLYDGRQNAGFKMATWNAGHQPSGLYLCRLESIGKVVTTKLTLVK